MFGRDDPLVTHLKAYGYNPVRLPRADIKPLQMLYKDRKDLSQLGELTSVLINRSGSNTQIPKTKENIPAANISGKKTADMSFGIGLSFLGNIISAMGGSILGLDIKYQQAKSISFGYDEVVQDKIELNELDKYLNNSDINPFSGYVNDLLDADEVYVITSVIKSKKFSVYAIDSRGANVQVNIPEIQGIVGSDVNVDAQSQGSAVITYEGKVLLVFGFLAVQVFYDNGVYTAFEPLQPKVALRALEFAPNDGTKKLIVDEPFVNVRVGRYKEI
jgi:hypothetical protein